MRFFARALVVIVALCFAMTFARAAFAQSADANAMTAISKAEGDYATGDTAKATSRINGALKACAGKCRTRRSHPLRLWSCRRLL